MATAPPELGLTAARGPRGPAHERVLDALAARGLLRRGRTHACPAHEDRRPSLSVTAAPDHVLVHCHAGCAVEQVVQALGMTMSDLFDAQSRPRRRPTTSGRIIETYDYRDADGRLLYQTVRIEPKRFFQRRPHPSRPSEWVNDLKGVPRVLYRLPELREALRAGRVIHVVEGERDVESLLAAGAAATCNVGGAGKWTPAFAGELAGAQVVIVADRDAAGRRHASTVAASLQGVAGGARVVEALEGKDATDHLAAGHAVKDFVEVDVVRVAAAQHVGPDATGARQAPAQEGGAQPDTDVANARRLVELAAGGLRHAPGVGWLAWTGWYWQRPADVEVMRLAKRVPALVQEEARETLRSHAQGADDSARAALEQRYVRLTKWARASASVSRLKAMIELAESEAGVAAAAADFDADPWLLSVENGTLELRSGRLRAHRPPDLISRLSHVTHDATATAPTWDRFLHGVTCGDEELASFLQQAVGYTLTGETTEQCFFFLWGRGANGKSTFLRTIGELLGAHAIRAPADVLMARGAGQGRAGAAESLARMAGARLVVASEVAGDSRFDEGLVKDLTGGEPIAAAFKYGHEFQYVPTAKLWIAGNHRPVVRGTDDAIWRRVRLIPFRAQLPFDRQDANLASRLRAELPGILNWALEGLRAWLASGRLREPESVKEATRTYRSAMDGLSEFLATCCEIGPLGAVTAAELHEAVVRWCEARGEPAPSATSLGKELRERGFQPHRDNRGRRAWRGLNLREVD